MSSSGKSKEERQFRTKPLSTQRITKKKKDLRAPSSVGSGIKRIQQQFIGYGLEAPVFENFQHGFKVVVSTNMHKVGEKVGEKVGDKVGETLSANQEKIIELIKTNSFISANNLSKEIGISQRKVEENMRKLKEINRIKRVGPDRGGHWEVIE